MSSDDTGIYLGSFVELEGIFTDKGERPSTSTGDEFHDSIALQKGVRSCTKRKVYSIGDYVSYNRLSPLDQAFLMNLLSLSQSLKRSV